MYIPLDYYRILGLPIQATAEQLRQSHRDRALQLPRREYSEGAIAARKQLLDEAYAVLSNSEQRRAYDASFLAKTYDLTPDVAAALNGDGPRLDDRSDAHTPSIEIHDAQLIGALLILQELGEYELVLKLGRPFLTGGSTSVRDGRFGDPKIVYADIVLTVALACLELGREQWQQGQYENAAEALETGQQLLLREGLFASLRGEVQSDLLKLRPYRVLELLALPETQDSDRQRGLHLLRGMLQERGGIDGVGADQSGLNVDDFLRFVQQLRGYLTVAEQQELFEAESQRPSAVATYLAVYALLARGFADRQPALIQRSYLLLQQLASRQDVNLEQAVCTLLLGQTELASRALEQSQEYESIAFIREHSRNSPDLLPGLCLYAERWLQEEVFPHFRDLANRRAALKEYFADRQVQEYLETLPTSPVTAPVAAPSVAAWRSARSTPSAVAPPPPEATLDAPPQRNFGRRGDLENSDDLVEVARARIAARSVAGVERTNGNVATGHVATLSAERVEPTPAPPSRARRGRSGGRSDGRPAQSEGESRPSRNSRFLLIPLVVFGVITFGIGVAWALKNWQASTKPIVAEKPLPSPAASPSAVASAPAKPAANTMTEQAAQELIQAWLTAKAAAMGQKHDIEKLDQVLLDPKLSYWKGQAQLVSRDRSYIAYKHDVVKVISVEQSKEKLDQAKAIAEVSEVREEFDESGKLRNSAKDQSLKIRYSLVRQGSEWRIQDWEVLS